MQSGRGETGEGGSDEGAVMGERASGAEGEIGSCASGGNAGEDGGAVLESDESCQWNPARSQAESSPAGWLLGYKQALRMNALQV